MSAATETQGRNGGAPEETIPAGGFTTYEEAKPFLRRPFTTVKWKVQTTWPKDNPTKGLVVPYIDGRHVIERLNHVCPAIWDDDFDPIYDGGELKAMWGRLTIGDRTRRDVGEGYSTYKGLVSDARKRAAVPFGIGISLYAVPKIVLAIDGQQLKRKPTGVTIETEALKLCRSRYEKWLKEVGVDEFGPALDHGDSEDSVGDIDAEPRERDTRRAADEPKADPVDLGEDPGDALDKLLTADHPLKDKRKACVAAMGAAGAGPAQMLREMQAVAENEKALDDLTKRAENAKA